MIVTKKDINLKTFRLLKKIAHEASHRGAAVFLVGGAVRDLLLKKQTFDLDFVLEEDATAFARALADKFGSEVKIHQAFKTATITLQTGQRIDFSSARKEVYRHAGALPTVSRGTMQEDLFRRDFTINAMAMNILPQRFGELIDPYGGYKDLKQRKIRILHEVSFLDDPTRMLRAVRYEQRLGFRLERATLTLLNRAMLAKALGKISHDRFFNEIKKILTEDDVVRPLKRLKQLKILEHLDSNLNINFRAVESVARNMSSSGPMKESVGSPVWFLYFMGMLDENDQQTILRIGARYNLEKVHKAALVQLEESRDLLTSLASTKCRASVIFERLGGITDGMLEYFWFRSSNKNVRRNIKRFLNDRKISLSINGQDLKKMGLKSGRRMGEVMDLVLKQKIDRRIKTHDDELRLAKSLIERN